MRAMHKIASILALAGMMSMPSISMAQPPVPNYGPGMWQQMTPEQRQQMWEHMAKQGYGPGMMMGPGMMGPGMMGPGMSQPVTPEQYKKWWDETHPANKDDKK